MTYIWLNSPVPIVVLQKGVLIEKTAVPPTHMVVANHPSFTDTNSSEVFETIHESALVDPTWKRPVFFRDDFVIAFCRSQIPRRCFELFGKRLIVEEYPRVLPNVSMFIIFLSTVTHLIFSVPSVLQLLHAMHHSPELRIPHKTNQRRPGLSAND